MSGVKIIEGYAFYGCEDMTHVEFDKLETVGGNYAFGKCTSLQRVKLPKVKTIGQSAFFISGVQDAEFGEDLQTIGRGAFWGSKLRRISIPLKDGMFQFNDGGGSYTRLEAGQFIHCSNLATVDLVGGIHKAVASLHLESWRNEMSAEIKRINQILPGTDHIISKADVIRQWIQSVMGKMDYFKAEHRALVKEVATLLELALWKTQLDLGETDNDKVGDEKETDFEEVKLAKKAKMDPDNKRKGARVTCGADVVIKNVMPFLMLE